MIPIHTEDLRLDYPLTSESLVIDAGGYKGDWASDIYRLYGCTIHVFEPVEQFYQRIVERFARNPNVIVHPVGLSDKECNADFGIQNDSTGQFAGSADRERVGLLDVAAVVEKLGKISLFKINTEGAEFAIIERLLETGLIGQVDNIQVQFHPCAPDAQRRFDELQAALAKTHFLTFDSQWVWQSWKKK